MTKDELKRRLLEAVDRRAAEIIGIGERIWRSPELGFKEVKTAKLVEETMRGIGLAPRTGLAFTMVRGRRLRSSVSSTRWRWRGIRRLIRSQERRTRAATMRRWRECWARRWRFKTRA